MALCCAALILSLAKLIRPKRQLGLDDLQVLARFAPALSLGAASANASNRRAYR